jgi:hypothetical protein
MPERITLTFTKEKDTKNTVKYAEDERPGQPPVVGSLYVAKWAAGGRNTLTVTIE